MEHILALLEGQAERMRPFESAVLRGSFTEKMIFELGLSKKRSVFLAERTSGV